MAVFTPITPDELDHLLERFDIGPHTDFQAISSGTVNSNYLVTCKEGQFVLTILEATSADKAQQLFEFVEHCIQATVPCPTLIKPKHYPVSFNGKPVALAEFLLGESCTIPSNQQCYQLGEVLGHLHSAGIDFKPPIENSMGHDWRAKTFMRLKDTLATHDLDVLSQAIALQKDLNSCPLPKGMVHYDLFRDNALYHNGKLTGIIDFYYACFDTLVFDLAVTINDWCAQWHSATPRLSLEKMVAMIQGYQSKRPLQKQEIECLFSFCKVACAHFWLARLDTLKQAKQGQGNFEKDPTEFKRLLEALNQQEPQFKAALADL